jgi:hypothetical protein
MAGMTMRGTADMARHGTARHGTAWHGMARHGTARHGMARHGMAWHGSARHGTEDLMSSTTEAAHQNYAAGSGHTTNKEVTLRYSGLLLASRVAST